VSLDSVVILLNAAVCLTRLAILCIVRAVIRHNSEAQQFWGWLVRHTQSVNALATTGIWV